MRPPLSVPTLSRRARIILLIIAALVVLVTALGALSGVLVDYWWYQETGYTSVFWGQLRTRALLFLIFGVATGVLVAANIALAYRMRPPFRPMSAEQQSLERYRSAMDSRRRLLLILLGVAITLFAGFTAQGDWMTWLQWRNGADFGVKDPQFGMDISFFAFDYPFYRLVLGYAFAIVLLSLAGAAIVYYLYGGIRLQTPGEKLTSAARVHLSVLLGLFVLLKALAYWLDRYGLVFSDRGQTTGASYTDVNAVLPAKTILLWVAVICAIVFFANVIVRNFALPAIALVLMVLASLIIGGAYPAIIDRFQVRPNADQLESEYIGRSIEATRSAYGIQSGEGGNVEYIDYPGRGEGDVTAQEIAADTATIPNTRLLDPNVISSVVQQTQQVRNIYGFTDQLDIDRYTIGDKTQDYIVSVRELETANLTENQQNWINQHTVYTHGYGLVAAPANQVGNGGVPAFTNSGFQSTGNAMEIPVDEPRIYYGELIDHYAIVGKDEGAEDVEFDRPTGEQDQVNTTYDGAGGVSIGSFFRQLVFAVNYREGNFILNSRIGDYSKVIYNQDPRERVEMAAPFIQADGDPYPAVVDGRIKWIVDGYTTSDGYPYSQQQTLGDVATDSLTGRGSAALPDETVNYIRNSLKATVDAYDGTVTLYEFDDKDPVLQTWMDAFPGIVQPKSEIPQELEAHFRYPEDLFKIQRDLLTRFHVSDPVNFFNGEDFWQVPEDPTQNTDADQPPYYVRSQLPGEDVATFQLTSPLSAQSQERDIMRAYVAASSDPEDYGTLRVLTMPQDASVLGPNQVQNRFGSEPEIVEQINLLNRGETQVIYGNLLTLPVADGLLYVEPVYTQRQGSSGDNAPVLRIVLAGFGEKFVSGATLKEALENLFGPGAGARAPQQAAVLPPPGEDGTEDGDQTAPPTAAPPTTESPTSAPPTDQGAVPGPGAGTTISPELAAAIQTAQQAQAEYQAATQAGDYAAAGAALQKWNDAQNQINQLLSANGTPPGG